MELIGLIQHMEVSRSKTIIIDRSLLNQYTGYVRTITIKSGDIVKVEFEVYGYDEGGITYFIQYENIDILVKSLEDYLEKKIEDWENISQTGYYPEKPDNWKEKNAEKKIEQDLISDNIKLPLNGIKMWMPRGYWKNLHDKIEGITL